MAYAITLQTSDSGINPGDKLGILSYAASNESSGSDAITIAASVYAEAEAEFTNNSNKTSLVFATSSSGLNDLTPQLRVSSSGHFLPIINNAKDLGAADLIFRNIYGNIGNFTQINTSSISGYIPLSNRGHFDILDNITSNYNISGGYIIGTLDLFLNGVKLIDGTDFTAVDGSGIVFLNVPESGSVVEYLTLFASSASSSSSTSHPIINAASDVDNSNNIFVQDLLLDQYGHVTGVVSVSATGALAALETDPIFTGSVAYNITSGDIVNWNNAYSWEDHSTIGYATTGELYLVSGYLQNQIDNLPSDTNTFITGVNYNNSQKELVLFRNDGASLTGDLSVVIHSGDNIDLLNNNVGYISSETDPIFTGSVAYNITANDTGNWNTAFGWGNHSGVGYLVSGDNISLLTNDIGYLTEHPDIPLPTVSLPSAPLSPSPTGTIIGYVESISFDNDGHLSGVIYGNHMIGDIYLTGVAFNNSTRNLTFSWNSNISNLSVNIPAGTGSIAPTGHISIPAASSSDNSGRTYIQDILLDEYGHVTGIATATETATGSGGGVLDASGIYNTLVAGTGISIAYSTGNNNITISNTGPTMGLVYFLS